MKTDKPISEQFVGDDLTITGRDGFQYWVEQEPAIAPHPYIERGMGQVIPACVRVFSNRHGFRLGCLSAAFWGETQEEAELLAEMFLRGV